MATLFLFFISFYLHIRITSSLDNGLARKPPLGWRSWNAFWFYIDQPTITACVDALLDKSRTVNDVATSLADIGYNNAGVDDGWQLCSDKGNYFHNDTAPNGWPLVNTNLFPDVSGMIQQAHSKKIGINWYLNNCHCAEQNKYPANEANDVAWLRLYDLDGVKLDGCGSSMNTSNWNKLINETGNKPILTEDGGNIVPPNTTNEEDCPMNMYNFAEGSGSSYAKYLGNQHVQQNVEWKPNVNYPLVIDAFQGITPFLLYPSGYLSRPGCWAFPGDLQVGNVPKEYGAEIKDMDQTLFSIAVVASSPLVLGFDLTNKTTMNRVWDIVTNPETLNVSQNWAGHPGRQVAYANYTYSYSTGYPDKPTAKLWGYEIWAKPQPSKKWAVLLMNNDGENPHNITVQFKDVPWNGNANIRDIVNHKDLGSFSNSYTAQKVPPFGSVFLLFSS